MHGLHRRKVLSGGVAIAAVSLAGPVFAQDFPSRPITFICPFPAGGIVDIVMRTFSEDLTRELGQPVAVDARPGASGMLASGALALAAPDGHTIMMATLSHLTAPLFTPAAYDPVSDFQSVARVAASVSVMCVPASLGVSTMAEFVELAKLRSGEFNYLKPGNGSFGHLTGEALKLATGIEMEAIDYAGLPPGILDMLAGRLELATLSTGLAEPHVREGTLVPIATVGSVRSPIFPDVPTLTEQGFDDANVESVYFVIAPAATPQGVVQRLHEALNTVLANSDVQTRLEGVGTIPLPPIGLDELQANMRSDYESFKALVESLAL